MDISGNKIMVPQGDLEPFLEFKITRNNVVSDSFSDNMYTVVAKNSDMTVINRNADIYDATNGLIRLELIEADTATIGKYLLTIIVTHPTNRPETLPSKGTIEFNVIDK